MGEGEHRASFWTTIPGIITALTGLIAAISGLIGGLVAAGIIGGSNPSQPSAVTPSLQIQSTAVIGLSPTNNTDSSNPILSAPTSAPTPTITTPRSLEEVVDQRQILVDAAGCLSIGGDSDQKLAQVVKAGTRGFLKEIKVPLGGTYGDITVEIQHVTANRPDGLVLASATLGPGKYPEARCSPQFLRVIFPDPAFIETGILYAFVLKSSGFHGTYRSPVGDPYQQGGAFYDARPNPPGWLPLNSGSTDLSFETLMAPQ